MQNVPGRIVPHRYLFVVIPFSDIASFSFEKNVFHIALQAFFAELQSLAVDK
jgi:hypothetical protein